MTNLRRTIAGHGPRSSKLPQSRPALPVSVVGAPSAPIVRAPLTIGQLLARPAVRSESEDAPRTLIYRLVRQPSFYHGKIPSLKMALWLRPHVNLITERFNFVEPTRGSFFDDRYIVIDVIAPRELYDALNQRRHYYHRSPIYLMAKEDEVIDGQDRITVLDDEGSTVPLAIPPSAPAIPPSAPSAPSASSAPPIPPRSRSRSTRPLNPDVDPSHYFPRWIHLRNIQGAVTPSQFNIALTYYEHQQHRLVNQIGIIPDDTITMLARHLEQWFLRIEEPVLDPQFPEICHHRNNHRSRGYSYYCHPELVEYIT